MSMFFGENPAKISSISGSSIASWFKTSPSKSAFVYIIGLYLYNEQDYYFIHYTYRFHLRELIPTFYKAVLYSFIHMRITTHVILSIVSELNTIWLVLKMGFEPIPVARTDFESIVSANSTIWAFNIVSSLRRLHNSIYFLPYLEILPLATIYVAMIV